MNVIKECPADDIICNDNIKTFNDKLKNEEVCKTAAAALDGLADDGTFPSDQFETCYKAIEPRNPHDTFKLYFFNPLYNCAKYGNPYHKGKDSN